MIKYNNFFGLKFSFFDNFTKIRSYDIIISKNFTHFIERSF